MQIGRQLFRGISSRAAAGLVAALAALGALGLAGCGGGGGGGGGVGGTPVTVSGRVLRAETGLAPNPAAVVSIGGASTTAGVDGTFSFTAPSGATSATISATGSQTRTISISLSTTTANNLGDIYLSDTGYTATVTGRVVASVSGTITGVGNATVNIANVSTISAADGTFTLNGLPVGLGNVAGVVGKVTATGFEDKPITDANLMFPLVAGANPIGDLLIATPSGSTPLPPYTIKGVVKVGGAGTAGVSIVLTKTAGGALVGNTSTDSTGTYTFWVAPGSFTINATNAGSMQTTTVVLSRLDTPVTAPTINF